MADITEKLNSERERIQLHKQALLKDRVSDLVEFHKTFKLRWPMPDDVAEIVSTKNKSPIQRAGSSTSAASDGVVPDVGPAGNAISSADLPTATATIASENKVAQPVEEAPVVSGNVVIPEAEVGPKEGSADEPKPNREDIEGAAAESKKGDKKTLFKFNTKASSFKPNVGAAPFMPKLSAPSSRASSSAGVA
ncbi:hypothetical protein GGI03_009087, partial [Coemansia sp. RSA 2337]